MGETVACEFLASRGFNVLCRNFRYGGDKKPGGGISPKAEIDIIAEDEKYIIFVEVKMRRDNPELRARYGRPSAAVTKRKQAKILYGIAGYLRQNPSDKQPRADVIEIYETILPDGGAAFEINHITGAFTK